MSLAGRKFIDQDAEIVYMPRDQVLDYAAREGATSFDAPGSEVHAPGRQVLVRNAHRGIQAGRGPGARPRRQEWFTAPTFRDDADITPQSRGLEAIARGFMELGVDDLEQLRLELPVYDALYAWARLQVANAGA